MHDLHYNYEHFFNKVDECLCNIDILKTICFVNAHTHIYYGVCFYGAAKKENMDHTI